MTANPEKDERVLATVYASMGRRILGVGSLWLLAGLVLFVALAEPPALLWQLFLLILAAGAVWMAEKMRRATRLHLELTHDMLRDSEGRTLARLDDISGIEWGMFAFKPSNGFLVTTKSRAQPAWLPGLWWRMGRRVGVGGMTPGSQTKIMADMISAMIAERSN